MNNFITQPSRPRKLGLLIFCEKGGKDLEKDANKTFITAACTGDRSESAAYLGIGGVQHRYRHQAHQQHKLLAVSYTHLTLPTTSIV